MSLSILLDHRVYRAGRRRVFCLVCVLCAPRLRAISVAEKVEKYITRFNLYVPGDAGRRGDLGNDRRIP